MPHWDCCTHMGLLRHPHGIAATSTWNCCDIHKGPGYYTLMAGLTQWHYHTWLSAASTIVASRSTVVCVTRTLTLMSCGLWTQQLYQPLVGHYSSVIIVYNWFTAAICISWKCYDFTWYSLVRATVRWRHLISTVTTPVVIQYTNTSVNAITHLTI